MLELLGIHAGYHGVGVLRDVSLRVAPQAFFGLLGANNAGKTTLVNVISGAVRPTAGAIRFDGAEFSAIDPREAVERGIIQVPEGRLLFPDMTVLENLMLGGLSRRAKPRRDATLERVFTLFPRLRERRSQKAGTLSGGEQQMAAIGRGLMADPVLLMLDEPSLGLSPAAVQMIIRVLVDLHRSGLTILLVEQNLKLTLSCTTRCAVLERGEVVLEGEPRQLGDDPRTHRAYMGL